MITTWDDAVSRLSNFNRYGIESPSKYTDLLAPRLPFTHSSGLQPFDAGEGADPLAHWSMSADGLAAMVGATPSGDTTSIEPRKVAWTTAMSARSIAARRFQRRCPRRRRRARPGPDSVGSTAPRVERVPGV